MSGGLHPILTCAEARRWEEHLLGSESNAEWEAMQAAGAGVALEALRVREEAGGLPGSPVVLVLCGGGHNTGDALLAAAHIARLRPAARVHVLQTRDETKMRPHARQALEQLFGACRAQPWLHRWRDGEAPSAEWSTCDILFDGLLGMQFSPPLREPLPRILRWANENVRTHLRVAVDVPSGLGDEGADASAFRADLTVATGIAKTPLFDPAHAAFTGRVRYADIGFFDRDHPQERAYPADLLTPDVLAPLRGLRPANADKRACGHVLLVGGSRDMPGALLMSASAAVRSGAGLVTALAPQSVAPAFAAALPEAMWAHGAESEEGGLTEDNFEKVRSLAARADALVLGPGMGREETSFALLRRIIAEIDKPLVLDADALHAEVIEALARRPKGAGAVVLTPHVGEFFRIDRSTTEQPPDDEALRAFAREHRCTLLLKGPHTRLTDGEALAISPFGGPVLARGGSGDLLAGMLGTQLARRPDESFLAACRAAVWHGLAADSLAQATGGAEAVRTTALLDHLADALLPHHA